MMCVYEFNIIFYCIILAYQPQQIKNKFSRELKIAWINVIKISERKPIICSKLSQQAKLWIEETCAKKQKCKEFFYTTHCHIEFHIN